MNVKASKALPTMGPIGSFESDFPCTKTVTTPGAADVGINVCVENDEEKSTVKVKIDVVGSGVDIVMVPVAGRKVLDVVDEDEVLVVEPRNELVVAADEVIKIKVVQKKRVGV